MTKYLKPRGNGRYQYVRRVPSDLVDLVGSLWVRTSLKTDDMELAAARMKKVNAATEAYWQALRVSGRSEKAEESYEASVKLARAMGLSYRPVADLLAGRPEDLLSRLEMVEEKSRGKRVVADAALGTAAKPGMKMSEALELYWIYTKDRLKGKNPRQVQTWRNARLRAVNYFTALKGDLDILEITRDEGLDFRNWWQEKIDAEGLTENAANKDFGNLAQILEVVSDMKRLGITAATNPFKNLRFSEEKKSRKPYPMDFLKDTLLTWETLKHLDTEERLLLLRMVDTGARPGELCGLELENGDIRLDGDIPYIWIRPNETRNIKTVHSIRQIPLVGLSLEAFRQEPVGLVKYLGDNDAATSSINKFLRENNLVPAEGRSLYSLRHNFEDRLTAVSPPEKVQSVLMGHRYNRPRYGDGPTLELKKYWLDKIVEEWNFTWEGG